MDAKAKSSQALSQALVCSFMVPLFGGVLYFLLPGVGEHPYLWGIVCMLSLGVASLGSAWLLHMSSSARWGGLQNDQRGWVLAAQCAGERFLALVRAGTPSDLAWTRACELLIREAPALAVREWGSSVWSPTPCPFGNVRGSSSCFDRHRNLAQESRAAQSDGRASLHGASGGGAACASAGDAKPSRSRAFAAWNASTETSFYLCSAVRPCSFGGWGLAGLVGDFRHRELEFLEGD